MTARPNSLAFARLVAFVTLAMLATFRAAPAGAEPTADGRAKAAAHFKQGQAYFQLNDYDRALAEYQAAFELSAEPLLIFNIALCHDRANRPEQALQDFQRYLSTAPNGPVADEAREDVARLVPIVEKLTADRRTAEARQRDETAKRAADRAKAQAQERPDRVRRYVVLAGAAVAVIGATFHVLSWRTRDRLVNAPDPESYFSDRDTFKLERGIAIGGYAAGAVTIATGLILGRVLRPRDEVQVSVTVTAGGAGVAVGWAR
jgi:tetratricopeptide (TPR) repeat protein